MGRVRGGIFSGAMVLAGLSATLISGLLAIGIRQVTHPAIRPTPIYVQPASGEVAVPDATPTASPSPSPATSQSSIAVAAPVAGPAGTGPVVRHRSGTTTGSVSSGGTVATVTTPAPAPAPSSSPAPTAPAHGNGKGSANGAGNSGGNGHHR